jgi:3-hydroxyacyl-CoA dehydrogenase/enoyl-CoA hydratase/3-hydroxybutyryl-CoA epimerase
VIVVNDGPGFYTTRTLSAYINEAGRLLDDGASIDAIDRALVDWGVPVGPIALLDEVGIDVGGKVGQVLSEAFGDRITPSESLRRLAASGRTGRKGASGFYRYDASGTKGSVDESVYQIIGAQRREIEPAEITERCVLAMVNEASRCLEERVLRSARDGDVGAVFGIGFPPFRGGPFRYADSIGAAQIVERLEDLDLRFHPRFAPAGLLLDMAASPLPIRAGSVSLRRTSVPCWMATDAMPAPMKPAPRTPRRSTSRGGGTGSGTPGSFLSALLAKNKNTNSRDTFVIATSPNNRASS